MTNKLLEELGQLAAATRGAGAGVIDNLAPGIPAREVIERLTVIGLEPSAELITWYGWQNGLVNSQVGAGSAQLTRFTPLSLDVAIRHRGSQHPGPGPYDFPQDWLPIGDFGGPEQLIIDCTPPASPESATRLYAPDGGLDAYPAVRSLTTVVAWWRRSLEEGWCVYNSEKDAWETNETLVPAEIRSTALV